ncbi:TRAP transporter substrate-binding protein [Lampropedia aestuarii]|uniref:TRAP transporter substrate-binding protein n=1 Tax=Lampropedia aestuarii TaxID=2562762 RepID=UPI002468C7A6|nr:TRAP transporter substrate-binding protein [Lampropedia aestuarii]MDH5858798.1 TRAP transporter substrate-binding protein [Lampropedia aestuarii]
MTIWKKLVLTAGIAIGMVMPLSSHAETVELTVSSWLPPTHSLVAGFIVPWMAEVEKETEGRVKPRLLPKAVTNAAGHYDAVRNGLVDLAFISHAYYPGRFELTKLGTLPLTGEHGEARSVAAWRIYDKYLKSAGEHRGVQLLGMYGHGPGMVMSGKKPVRQIEDFNGLKVRLGGGMAADVAKVLNVNAVVKPAPESYELLSTGVVDGVFLPAESLVAFRLDEVVQSITRFPGGLYGDSHGFIMNERSYKKLSEQDRAIIDRLSGEHLARLAGAAWGGADNKSLALAKDKGIEIIDADAALVEAVRDRTAPFEQAWLDAASKHNIDGPAVMAEYRSMLQELDAEIAARPTE